MARREELLAEPEEQPDGTWLLDGGDLGCARLLVLLRNVVAGLPVGAVVHLQTTDPVAPIDLPAWCRMTGHGYLGPVTADGTPRYAVEVAGSPAVTAPESPWRLA
ncbi:sulfurtransferase TusA family protein [Nocardioides pacificus]